MAGLTRRHKLRAVAESRLIGARFRRSMLSGNEYDELWVLRAVPKFACTMYIFSFTANGRSSHSCKMYSIEEQMIFELKSQYNGTERCFRQSIQIRARWLSSNFFSAFFSLVSSTTIIDSGRYRPAYQVGIRSTSRTHTKNANLYLDAFYLNWMRAIQRSRVLIAKEKWNIVFIWISNDFRRISSIFDGRRGWRIDTFFFGMYYNNLCSKHEFDVLHSDTWCLK